MTSIRPYEFKELKPKRSKYGNTKVEYGGEQFDSTIERNRWLFLQGEENAGRISGLERQVALPLIVNQKKNWGDQARPPVSRHRVRHGRRGCEGDAQTQE